MTAPRDNFADLLRRFRTSASLTQARMGKLATVAGDFTGREAQVDDGSGSRWQERRVLAFP